MLTPTRVAPGPASAAFSAASPCTPPQHPILRGSALRGINEGSSNSPVRPFPSPAAARMERVAASAFPRASHPADQEPDNARRGGDRPPSTDLELHAQLTSVDLRSGSSLVVCDLASHATMQKRGGVVQVVVGGRIHAEAGVSPSSAGALLPLVKSAMLGCITALSRGRKDVGPIGPPGAVVLVPGDAARRQRRRGCAWPTGSRGGGGRRGHRSAPKPAARGRPPSGWSWFGAGRAGPPGREHAVERR